MCVFVKTFRTLPGAVSPDVETCVEITRALHLSHDDLGGHLSDVAHRN